MSRLFITEREIDFINDLHKEVIKDVIGQTVFLFPISITKTRIHDIYGESSEKIFENPIELDCRVLWSPPDTKTDRFGIEKTSKLEFYVSQRDMIQRNVTIVPGDFVSYGTIFYEIVSTAETHNIFGQIDHMGGLKVNAVTSRKENFVAKVLGPKGEQFTDPDAVQKTFHQQRGFAENGDGVTGDVRDLVGRGVLETPLSPPSEVSPRGSASGSAGSSFYTDNS